MKDGDRVLIAEGCTHHRQCDDIGTVKIPRWLKTRTGKEISIETSSSFPEDLAPYALVIHCGGWALNGREMQSIGRAVSQGVPVTNYGDRDRLYERHPAPQHHNVSGSGQEDGRQVSKGSVFPGPEGHLTRKGFKGLLSAL